VHKRLNVINKFRFLVAGSSIIGPALNSTALVLVTLLFSNSFS
jgi:hypothetical protein